MVLKRVDPEDGEKSLRGTREQMSKPATQESSWDRLEEEEERKKKRKNRKFRRLELMG